MNNETAKSEKVNPNQKEEKPLSTNHPTASLQDSAHLDFTVVIDLDDEFYAVRSIN